MMELRKVVATLRALLVGSAWLAASIFWLPPVGRLQAEPWRRHTIDRSSRGADGVRLADANGDGRLDIATGWEEGASVRVYLNPGPGAARSAWPVVSVGEVRSPEDALLVDLDGDGFSDVVSCCEGSNRTVYVHWAPASREQYLRADRWRTTPLPCTHKRQQWMFAVAADIDARHGPDLLVGSKGKAAAIGWLEAPADPRRTAQWKYHPLRAAGWIMSLQTHDMDQDGDLDVLASDRVGSARGVFWLENPGGQANVAGAAWREHHLGGRDREVMFLDRADLDADGKQDVVCAVRGRGPAWFRPPAIAQGPWMLDEIAMPPGCGTGKGIAIGDIDLDGRQDLVFTCENAQGDRSGVRWLAARKTPAGQWSDHEISGREGVKFDRVELLDLDGDGDLDALTCEERQNLGVIWYENPHR